MRLRSEDDDLVQIGREREQLLDGAHARHAVADDDQARARHGIVPSEMAAPCRAAFRALARKRRPPRGGRIRSLSIIEPISWRCMPTSSPRTRRPTGPRAAISDVLALRS